MLPGGCGRQLLSKPGKDDKDKVAYKTEPDNPPRLLIAVDLSQDITKNIAEWEEYNCSWQSYKSESNYFAANDISS